MQYTAAVFRTVSCLCFVSALVAQAGSPPASELVVIPNQPFPPVPGAFVAQPLRSSVDHHGNVAWLGHLATGPGGVTSSDDQVLCISRNTQDVTLLAREGSPDPMGRPGVTLTELGEDVVISPTGQHVLWVGRDTRINGVQRTVYLSSAQGTTALIAFDDHLPPPRDSYRVYSLYSDLRGSAVSASGRVKLHVTPFFSDAIIAGVPGQLETVLYDGLVLQSLPSQPQLQVVDALNVISPDGGFPFSGRLALSSGTPPSTFDDWLVLGYVPFGQPPVILERQGDPALGVVGLENASFQVNCAQSGEDGEFTYVAQLYDPAIRVPDHWALYRASTQGGAPQLVLHSGMVLADGSTVASLGERVSIGLQGKLGTWCTRTGPNITVDNDEAFLVGQPGAMSILFREGDPLPTMPGATFGGSGGGSGHSFDRYDNLVLRCQAVTPSGTSSLTLAYHPDRGYQNLFQEGQVFPTPLGLATLTTDEGGMARAAGGASTSMHGLYGDVARVWTMNVTTSANGSGTVATGIVRTHVGALSPSTASIPATGGFQMLPLAAGAARANYLYLMVGSLTGTAPGFQYGGVDIPLVNDFWTGISQVSANSSVYMNTLGLLDGAGRTNMAFALPSSTPYLQGALFHHAVLVLDPTSADLTWVSEPVSVHIF